MSLPAWVRGFGPGPATVNASERLRACLGALLGLLVTGFATRLLLGPGSGLPLLLAPMAASAILLFAVPASPLAQPWSLVGGNLVSTAIGVACAQWIPDPFLAAGLGLALAIAAMFALRCLHPPSGALVLVVVFGNEAVHAAGYRFIAAPVMLNSVLLLAVAIVYNNLTRRRYPHAPHLHHPSMHETKDMVPSERVGITAADLDAVLRRYNQVLDVSLDDLESLILQAEREAYRRHTGGIVCADVMARDIVSVQYGTSLEEAWELLRRHHIGALPVVDRVRRVVGMITMDDFLRHADLATHDTLGERLRRLVRRTLDVHSDKPEVVGQIMTAPVPTAAEGTPVVELVPVFSDTDAHHIPVVDHERRLTGIVTQSEVVAALYRNRVESLAPAA